MIQSILGINPNALGAGILAVIVGIVAIFFRGAKAGSDSQKAKEGKANAQAIKDIADANRAAARANTGKLHDDDGFKRKG